MKWNWNITNAWQLALAIEGSGSGNKGGLQLTAKPVDEEAVPLFLISLGFPTFKIWPLEGTRQSVAGKGSLIEGDMLPSHLGRNCGSNDPWHLSSASWHADLQG